MEAAVLTKTSTTRQEGLMANPPRVLKYRGRSFFLKTGCSVNPGGEIKIKVLDIYILARVHTIVPCTVLVSEA